MILTVQIMVFVAMTDVPIHAIVMCLLLQLQYQLLRLLKQQQQLDHHHQHGFHALQQQLLLRLLLLLQQQFQLYQQQP